LAKHDFLRNISLEKDLDFIAILKTYKNNFSEESLPCMVSGDFNIIRNPLEKIMKDLIVDGMHCSMLALNLSI
jgi:hypothetical protein